MNDSAVVLMRPLAEESQADPSWRSIADDQLADIAAVQGRLSEATRRAKEGMAGEVFRLGELYEEGSPGQGDGILRAFSGAVEERRFPPC
jgi:hypothetical protein